MAYYNKSSNYSYKNNSPCQAKMTPCEKQPASCSMVMPRSMPEPDCPAMPYSMQGVDSMPLAMSYVPWQEFGELYPPCKALAEGTAFPELNIIFCGVRG